MRISEIKSTYLYHPKRNTLNRIISGYYWENRIFRDALSALTGTPSLKKVYYTIRTTTVNMLDEMSSNPETALMNGKTLVKNIKVLSKSIYDDPNKWVYDTPYEHIVLEKKRLLQEKQHQQKIRLQMLEPLYERLKLEPSRKPYDVINLISRTESIALAVLGEEMSIVEVQSREDLYNRVLLAVLAKISIREVSQTEITIMKTVSYLAFHDASFWLKTVSNNEDQLYLSALFNKTTSDKQQET